MKPTGTIRDIVVGAKITFVPASFSDYKQDSIFGSKSKHYKTTGVIDYVNYEHRYFRVRYECNGKILYQSLKF